MCQSTAAMLDDQRQVAGIDDEVLDPDVPAVLVAVVLAGWMLPATTLDTPAATTIAATHTTTAMNTLIAGCAPAGSALPRSPPIPG